MCDLWLSYSLEPNIHDLGSFLSYVFVLQTQYVYILFVIHDHDSF